MVLIASRGEALQQNFRRLSQRMSAQRKDVMVTMLMFSAVSRTRKLLRAFRDCVKAGGHSFRGGGVPSSGLVLIANLMDICQQVSVYGFGQEKVPWLCQPTAPPHDPSGIPPRLLIRLVSSEGQGLSAVDQRHLARS